jgi:hypothetical protein
LALSVFLLWEIDPRKAGLLRKTDWGHQQFQVFEFLRFSIPMEKRSSYLHSCARASARMCNTDQEAAGLYKRVQRTPLESTNTVVRHADQEQCGFEDLAV